MKTNLYKTKPEHEVAFQELVQLVSKHADKITAVELLAVAANMLGKLVALQDQREFSPTMVMEIIAKNIEHGNKQALEQLSKTVGSA
jgi:hypothetical protein